MFPEATALDMLTELSRSQTLLFMTGAYEDGDQDNVSGDSYEAMQERIEYAYTQLGARIRNRVVPVGTAWKQALERDPALDFWEDDGRRPSEAGSYLTACVFYAFWSAGNPWQTPSPPGSTVSRRACSRGPPGGRCWTDNRNVSSAADADRVSFLHRPFVDLIP